MIFYSKLLRADSNYLILLWDDIFNFSSNIEVKDSVSDVFYSIKVFIYDELFLLIINEVDSFKALNLSL